MEGVLDRLVAMAFTVVAVLYNTGAIEPVGRYPLHTFGCLLLAALWWIIAELRSINRRSD